MSDYGRQNDHVLIIVVPLSKLKTIIKIIYISIPDEQANFLEFRLVIFHLKLSYKMLIDDFSKIPKVFQCNDLAFST